MDFELKKCCKEINEDLFEQSVLLTPRSGDDEFVPIDISKQYSLGGGVVIANYKDEDGGRRVIVAPPGHTLLVGSTGSGKTEGFYLPQIEMIGKSKDQVSFVVMDMKGNMYRQKAQMLKDNGFEVVVLNGKNPFVSSKYNPLSVIFRAYRRAKDAEKLFLKANTKKMEFLGKKYDDYLEFRYDVEQYMNMNIAYCHQMIDKICEIVVPIESTKDPSWDYGAREIFKCLIYLLLEDSDREKDPLTEEQFTLYNVANMLDCRGDGCGALISYVNTHKSTSRGRKLLNYIESNARQTRDSFLMTAMDKINRVVNIPMNVMSASSDIDLDELSKSLGNRRTAIFLIADSANKSIYTLCNLFLVQLIVALQKYGDENPKGDFHIFADEFCNMVPMPDIIDWITTMRSRRTWFHLGIQSYSQLDHHYGEKVRNTIEGNSKTIFMGSNDYGTLSTFSQALGLTMKVAHTYALDNSGNLSLSMASTNVPLVKVSDLANLKLGEAYIKLFGASGNKIMKTELEPDFKAEDFAHGNATPEIVKRHTVQAEENLYDIRTVRKERGKSESDDFSDLPKERDWENFFDMDSSPFRSNRIAASDERRIQTKIKGIIAKLSEREKAMLVDLVKDREYAELNKYLSTCKEIGAYAIRFRLFGILTNSVGTRLALTSSEYDLFKKQLLEMSKDVKKSDSAGSADSAVKTDGTGDVNPEGKSITRDSTYTSPYKIQIDPICNADEFRKWDSLSATRFFNTTVTRRDADDKADAKDGKSDGISPETKNEIILNGFDNADSVTLPMADKQIKIEIDNKNSKVTDGGETFKAITKVDGKDKEQMITINNIIASFGVTKRFKDDKIVLEKLIINRKNPMTAVLDLYTVIVMIKRIGTLSAAFPHDD